MIGCGHGQDRSIAGGRWEWTKNKQAALDMALARIEKDYGKGAVMRLGEIAQRLLTDAISTGSLALDLALGIGGIPRGRVTEIFGAESAGKSTLAIHIMAETQKAGGIAAYVDVEHALDPPYAGNCGLDVDELLIAQPDSAEQALDITEQLVRSGAVDAVVIDSVAALVPQAEIEGDMGDTHVGLQARLMSQALRKLTSTIHRSHTAVIFINQLREKIGISYGNPEVTPGGRALKFYSSVRIDLRRVESIKQGSEVTGNRVRARVRKEQSCSSVPRSRIRYHVQPWHQQDGRPIGLGGSPRDIEKVGSLLLLRRDTLGPGPRKLQGVPDSSSGDRSFHRGPHPNPVQHSRTNSCGRGDVIPGTYRVPRIRYAGD